MALQDATAAPPHSYAIIMHINICSHNLWLDGLPRTSRAAQFVLSDSMKILNAMPPYNLFGVENPDFKDAMIAVLPIPYDSTVTYKSGSRDGPHAIIDASRNMEMYSEEFDGDVTQLGIYTLEEMAPNLNSPEENINMIQKEVSNILDNGKIPVILGGEHTVMVGAVRAVAAREKDMSVLHFDAHSDYRDSYSGSKFNHACVMARAREACPSCFSVGIRSTDEVAARKYGKDMLYRKDMHKMSLDDVVDAIVNRTKDNLYITIDMDVMDPSEMPSLGTPEPDGLSFYELTYILRGVLSKKKLLGIDFNELCPIPGMIAPNYLVAKLVYMALGYAFFAKK